MATMTDEELRRLLYVPLGNHISSRLEDMDKAVAEARRQMETRMDGFPDQFVKRGEVSEQMSGIMTKVDLLVEFKSRAEGMATQSSVDTVWWVSIAGLVIAILGLVLRLFKV